MGSTAHTKIEKALETCPSYIGFRNGHISAAAYQKWVESEGLATIESLNEDQINLSARFPHDLHDFVSRALAHCRALDLIPDDQYDPAMITIAFSDVFSKYNHDQNLTYIFPEESALLYAIVQNTQPRNAVFMGSYYGYWAAAAKAAHPNLSVTLIDINAAVMKLASQNFVDLGLAQSTHFRTGDAEALVSSFDAIDLLVLDAEGPKSEDVPVDYRDKAIYYPHLKAALVSLAPGALVVAHNVILSNFTGGRYFQEKQKSYRKQYTKFLGLLQDGFVYTVIDSTEGTLVARKR